MSIIMPTYKTFQEQLERYWMEGDREKAISFCREYAECCREVEDWERLADVLDDLKHELHISGREDEANKVFADLFELRKAMAQQDFEKYGEAYALMLNRKSCSCDIDEAIACQEEAIDIYKRLGLYDEKGFDIGLDDAFGHLGLLYCHKGDYELGIRYTTIALERALNDDDNHFIIGLFYQRLCIAHLSLDNLTSARTCLLKSQDYFARDEQENPDPDTFPHIAEINSALMTECDKRTHSDEYYKQWLIG